jgi:hypothetical protein
LDNQKHRNEVLMDYVLIIMIVLIVSIGIYGSKQ